MNYWRLYTGSVVPPLESWKMKGFSIFGSFKFIQIFFSISVSIQSFKFIFIYQLYVAVVLSVFDRKMHKKGFAVRDVVHNYYTVVVPVQHCMHSNIVKKMLGEKRWILARFWP